MFHMAVGRPGKGVDICLVISLACPQWDCKTQTPIALLVCNAVSIKQSNYNNLLTSGIFFSHTLFIFKEQVSCKTPQGWGSTAIPWLPVQLKEEPWFGKTNRPHVLGEICYSHWGAGVCVSPLHKGTGGCSGCQRAVCCGRHDFNLLEREWVLAGILTCFTAVLPAVHVPRNALAH